MSRNDFFEYDAETNDNLMDPRAKRIGEHTKNIEKSEDTGKGDLNKEIKIEKSPHGDLWKNNPYTMSVGQDDKRSHDYYTSQGYSSPDQHRGYSNRLEPYYGYHSEPNMQEIPQRQSGYEYYNSPSSSMSPYSGYDPLKSVRMMKDSRRKPKLRVCSNCVTTTTPSWRRSTDKKKLLCNACGLYQKLHHKPRPFSTAPDGKTKAVKNAMDKIRCIGCGSLDSPVWKKSPTRHNLCINCSPPTEQDYGSKYSYQYDVAKRSPYDSYFKSGSYGTDDRIYHPEHKEDSRSYKYGSQYAERNQEYTYGFSTRPERSSSIIKDEIVHRNYKYGASTDKIEPEYPSRIVQSKPEPNQSSKDETFEENSFKVIEDINQKNTQK